MEKTFKYKVLKVGEQFCMFEMATTSDPRIRSIQTMASPIRFLPNNHKTRRIYKIYENNPPLGAKLFEAYLDKHPYDTATVNNGRDK